MISLQEQVAAMSSTEESASKYKLSPEFVKRLQRLNPDQQVRAIVMLHTPDARNPAPGAQRQTQEQRQAAIASMREAGQRAWGAIAPIIEQFEGHPLATQPSVLGAIPIEIKVAGIRALAESEWVNAILEDQRIYPFQKQKITNRVQRHS